ncbi:hypothetical protein [Aurantimonas sp. HBX-1]|uniref:hypothetical protein n=1 Tax=Aurantimonas sp. HBX-1 TaxID=2906072 RepID=UPI001F37D3A3|nr:hypothetical protein [Aurantimonas sp. HBX-1]UIJ73936.1 hypothetical protein LXB15_10145 [Aurantimonas sp. HBX-1]
MAGLNLAVQIDPPAIVLPWPLGGEMYVPEASPAAPEPGVAEMPAPLQAVPRAASGKAERLPALAVETGTAPAASRDVRAVELAPPPRDVMLFDACMPLCESRDPLIAANRSPAEAPAPAPAVARVAQSAGYIGEAVQSTSASSQGSGFVEAAASRVAAASKAGYHTVAGGLMSLTPW